MTSPKLRRALSAWPIFVIALVAIGMSLAAGCGDDCQHNSRFSNCDD